MSLVATFQASAALELRQALAELPNAEAVLRRMHAEGQARWPPISVAPEAFVSFLARQLSAESLHVDALPRLHIGDLFLTCALWLGSPIAQAIFQREYMPRIRRALLKHGTSEDIICDAQQSLFQLLLEAREPGMTSRGYGGRGELVSWLCTCAIRELGHRRKREERLRSLDEIADEVLLEVGRGPELDVMRRDLKNRLRAALEQALAELSSRERNVLRYHFLSGHSIDTIGDIYRVHRATAARWLARAQKHIVERTRELFMNQAQIQADSLPHVWNLIASKLSLSLGSLLRAAAEPPSEANPRAT